MIYSDFYKVIVSISNSNNVRHFIEFAKAWLADKDIDEGKMWYYYVYVMCDKIRKAEMECYEEEVGRKRFDDDEDDDDEFSKYHIGAYRRGGGRGRGMRSSMGRRHEYEMDEYEREREREREREEYEPYSEYGRKRSTEISQGNRYFIYYNKCNGIFQTVNHIVPPTATPSES